MSYADDLTRYLTPSIAAADAQSLEYGADHPGRGPLDKLRLEQPGYAPAVPTILEPSNPGRSALSSDPTLAAVGNANAGPLFRRPGPSLKSRILEGIQGGMAGIAAASPPSDTSFLPSLARSFTGTANSIDAHRQQDYQRQLQASLQQRQGVLDQSTLDEQGARARYYDAQANAKAEPAYHPIDPSSQAGIDAANKKAEYAAGLKPPGQESPNQIVTGADGTLYRVNPRGPEGVVNGAKGKPMPVKGASLPKPSLGAETAYGIYPVLVDADREMDRVAGTSRGALLSKGGTLGNYLITPEQRQYNSAADDFALQYVTAVHGKRVSQEVTNGVRNMLRIAPGDDAATIQAKVARRKTFLKAVQGMQAGASTYHQATDGGPAASTVTPAERAQLKAQGYTDDEINGAQ